MDAKPSSCCSHESAKSEECSAFLSSLSLSTTVATIRARDGDWNTPHNVATFYACSTLMLLCIYVYDCCPENCKRSEWLKVPILTFALALNGLVVCGAFTNYLMAFVVWSLVASSCLLTLYSVFISFPPPPRPQSQSQSTHHYQSLPVQVEPMDDHHMVSCKLEV